MRPHHPTTGDGRPFVGRAAEHAILADALARARAGRGRFLLLVGEAGIGKTSTLEEFVARADLDPSRVWWGRCPEHRGAPAFWPWAEAMRAYVTQVADDRLRAELGASAAEIALVVPAVRERLPDLATAPLPSHDEARFRLFVGLSALLARVAATEPLVILLDDLHCADEGSLQLLAHVARELSRMRVLVVGAQRSEPRHGLRASGGALQSAAQFVSLRGLDLLETGELVRATAGSEPHGELIESLHRESAGNPAFIEETLLVLKAEGKAADGATAPERRPSEGIRALIRRRTSQLEDDERQLIELAAVLGTEFDVASLQAASALPAGEVIAILAAAARFVAEVPEAVGRFRFLQRSVRETLYGDLSPSQRVQLHRRVGLAMEEAHQGSPDVPAGELAYHFFRAAPLGEADRAVAYATRAGREAVDLLGYEEAVRHFETALRAASFLPKDVAARLRLLLALGDAAWRTGDALKARRNFVLAARAASTLDAAQDLARAALGYGRASTESGAVDAVLVGLLEEALAALGGDHGSLRAMLQARLSMALYFSGEDERRDALSQEAVEVARREGDATALAATLINRHFVLWGPRGTIQERLAIAREAMQLEGDPALHLESQVWLIFDLLEVGDMAAADLAIARFAQEGEALLLPTYLWHAALMRTTRASIAGRFAEAALLAAAAVGPLESVPQSVPAQFHCTQRFFILREIGGLEELRAPLQYYADTYPTLTTWRTGLMLFHSEIGEEAAARAVFEQLAGHDFADLPRDGLWLPALAELAEVAARLGDVRCGELLYALLAPHAERNLVVALSAGCLGPTSRYLGLLAHLVGRVEEAERHFEAALAMSLRMGARPFAAHVRHDYGRMLLQRGGKGDRERARELLAEARRTTSELGMVVLGRRLDCVSEGVAASPTPASGPIPEGNDAALAREDGHWLLSAQGESCRLKDTKGLHYLATLLRHPNQEFHALDLALGAPGGEGDIEAPAASPSAHGAARAAVGDAGEMLDDEARSAYKRRLVDLREEEQEAREQGDPDRAERAHAEIEALARELARAVGLGGRSRKAASDVERARLNVTRAITAVVRKIAAETPRIGQHLTATVRTGTFCVYVPDPRLPIRWKL